MRFCRPITALSIPPFLLKALSLTSLYVVVGQPATTQTLIAPVPAVSESLGGETTSVRTLWFMDFLVCHANGDKNPDAAWLINSITVYNS